MKKQLIKKISAAILLVMGIHIAFASISLSGISGEKMKTSKYSLKNLNGFHRSFMLTNLKYSLHYKGTEVLSQTTLSNGNQIFSMMSYDNGNTTYIVPQSFKVKIKMPKFKLPSRTE